MVDVKMQIQNEKQTSFNTFRFKYHLKTFRPTYGPFTLCYSFIAPLRNIEIEANKLFDRALWFYDAARLTRCYTQHALWPYIDSETNHIENFIKIQFSNKGIEFINLPGRIFKDKSVNSSIPTYFENKEAPIICYKYNKLICSTVLTTTN